MRPPLDPAKWVSDLERKRIARSDPPVNTEPASLIGLSGKEISGYSIARIGRDTVTGDWAAGTFESACHDTISARRTLPSTHGGIFVPYEVLHRRSIPMTRADTVGAGAGSLVATETVSFIDVLRNRAVAYRLGARPLPGLIASTACWLPNEVSQVNSGRRPVWGTLNEQSCRFDATKTQPTRSNRSQPKPTRPRRLSVESTA